MMRSGSKTWPTPPTGRTAPSFAPRQQRQSNGSASLPPTTSSDALPLRRSVESAVVADEDEGGPEVRVLEGALALRRRPGLVLRQGRLDLAALAPRQSLRQVRQFPKRLLPIKGAEPFP